MGGKNDPWSRAAKRLLPLLEVNWHPHIISLYQRAMRHVNRLRSISNLVPRFTLFSIYNSFILPIFDYGSVVYDTCSQSDALLLDSAQTTAAKIITGCIKTTANDAVLNDISLVKLGTGREKQILLYYYMIIFGMASPPLHRTYFSTHIFEKLLVCGMHYQFLSNLPLVSRPLNYV